jgi:hypothetical protein
VKTKSKLYVTNLEVFSWCIFKNRNSEFVLLVKNSFFERATKRQHTFSREVKTSFPDFKYSKTTKVVPKHSKKHSKKSFNLALRPKSKNYKLFRRFKQTNVFNISPKKNSGDTEFFESFLEGQARQLDWNLCVFERKEYREAAFCFLLRAD